MRNRKSIKNFNLKMRSPNEFNHISADEKRQKRPLISERYYLTCMVSVQRHVRDQSLLPTHNRWRSPCVCQHVPEQPGDPLLSGLRLQSRHGTPPCSLGSSLQSGTKLPANARFLDMDIKGIRLEKRAHECRG